MTNVYKYTTLKSKKCGIFTTVLKVANPVESGCAETKYIVEVYENGSYRTFWRSFDNYTSANRSYARTKC